MLTTVSPAQNSPSGASRANGGGPLALLAALPLLQGVPGASLARLASVSTLVRLEKGAWLFRRADGCNGFYVVGWGSLSLAYHSPHGAEKIVEIVRPGQSCCEALMLVDRPWPISARALEETTVLPVSRLAVTEEMAREPALARCLVAGLSRRLRALREDLGANELRSGAGRFVAYLLEGADSDAEGPLEIALPRKGDLASRLSMSAEHFSRILRKLDSLGLIDVAGRVVRVPDPARLRAYCGQGRHG